MGNGRKKLDTGTEIEKPRTFRSSKANQRPQGNGSEAGPTSDLDLLVTFESGARIGLELVALKQELEVLIGRPVDLLTRASVERSPNKYFRHYALRGTEQLYEPD
ncbi:MAG: nucleotidyltransferase domain-containing protein [Thermodesulfobacteriota bacterium]